MRKGKILKISIIAFLIGFIFIGEAFCFSAEVENLSGSKYFYKLKEVLKNAKKSIYMVMYYGNFDPRDRTSSVYQLVQELINAHKRGVEVKVILDQNIPYWGWDAKDEWKVEGKNESIFIHLKKEGVEVYYDNRTIITHGKVIVIDKEKVILGSTNWTPSALHRNYEASVLIESSELAQELIKDFSKIIIDYEASILDKEKKSPIKVSRVFLKDPSLAGRMLSMQDEIAFDIYLLLLKEFDGNPEGEIDFDYRRIGRTLGLDPKTNYLRCKRNIRGALIRLHERYNLIERRVRPPKLPDVRLLNYPDRVAYRSPENRFFSIPDDYWRYGWSKRLSFPEKYCYLINLYKTGMGRKPCWRDYIIALQDQFNVSENTITRGMMGLRKLNIIDIRYSDYPKGGYAGRDPTSFRFLGLYSPEKLEEQIDRLKTAYGKEGVEKARTYAEVVYKGNNIAVIKDIIEMTSIYGESQIDRAFTYVAGKVPDNHKRSFRYVIGILKGEAAKEE